MKLKLSSFKRRKSKTSPGKTVCEPGEGAKEVCEVSASSTSEKEVYEPYRTNTRRPPNFDASYGLSPPPVSPSSGSGDGHDSRTQQTVQQPIQHTMTPPTPVPPRAQYRKPTKGRGPPYMWLMIVFASLGFIMSLRGRIYPSSTSTGVVTGFCLIQSYYE